MLPVDQLPSAPEGGPFDLLSGVRVLDFTTSIAGPYATMLLADLGAEVVKVERPGSGDDARAWGPPFLQGESLWFLSVNRNKRSLALDYRSTEGRKLLQGLVAQADVVITNQIGPSQEKLGLDYATLSAIRSDLIFVSLTGFGLRGARAALPCYDLIAEGYSGVMDMTGEPENGPQKVGTPAADLLAGMDAAYATVAALYDRGRTGRGHQIDVALTDSMTRFMTPRLVPYLGSGELPRRAGGRDSVIAIYQVFDTADEPITLGLGNDNIWKRFWQAVGQPDRAADPRFADNAGRRAARAEIAAEIQSILIQKPRDHWLDKLAQAKVPAGPINRLDQVSADSELQKRGLFYALDAEGRKVPQVGLGIQLDGRPAGARRPPPPQPGSDAEAVLAEWLGYSDESIHALRQAGVV